MKKGSSAYNLRANVVGAIFLILGILLAGRLFFIQVVNGDVYAAFAEKQLGGEGFGEDIAIRGDIYFQEKDGDLVSAAAVKRGFLLALNPNFIKDADKTCQSLLDLVAGSFEFDKNLCLKKAQKKGDPFEILIHHLNEALANKIKKLGLKGVGVYPEEWRFYPGNSLAAHVLGFVGYKGDELVGRYGLEKYYEGVLRGQKEKIENNSSFSSILLNLGRKFLNVDLEGGHGLVLTIEPRVQALLESVLDQTFAETKSESAGGIIMNPKTGEVLAMAKRPAFNPNSYGKVEDFSLFDNSLISSIFEMGSVFKPLTLAAAIDAQKITPETTYIDNGFVIVDGKRIENYDAKGRGRVDMQQVLNQSLNTGAVFVMKQLGKERFKEYMYRYGLGEKTGIDLPNEARGHLGNLDSARDVEYATASFGQGIAVTPIAFASAVSALANGGLLVKPFVVKKIILTDKTDRQISTQIKRRVLKEETSRTITRMLVKTVDQALLGGTVKLRHFSVAAKTGTAQIPKKDEPGYYNDRYLHSFFGYAPAFDARFLIFLYLEKPVGVRYASQSLTHPFMNLMKFLLDYYKIPPDR
jgi:cell division protein FtsI (penicillin-binding protein 3)/stage V sporulation protein D (sporulation-specific penicillin-binding protein)